LLPHHQITPGVALFVVQGFITELAVELSTYAFSNRLARMN